MTLTRSILVGSTLPQPLQPHVQPLYYAAIVAAEFIGSSCSTRIVELTVNNTQISGYAAYEDDMLVRAVFINLNAYTTGTRRSMHLTFDFSGDGIPPSSIVVKRLFIP